MLAALTCQAEHPWRAVDKIPIAIRMLGRNCGWWYEDDLLMGDGEAVVGESSPPEGSMVPASKASSLQRAGPRCTLS